MLPFWRLDPPFRFAVYIAFAVLSASGAAWLAADRMKESSEEEIWQESAAWLIMPAWRHRHVDLDAAWRPRPRAYRACLARQKKSRHRHRHGRVQRGADRDRLWALLPRLGNLKAMGERHSYCVRIVLACVAPGARQDRAQAFSAARPA
jgi:hypothetical protein